MSGEAKEKCAVSAISVEEEMNASVLVAETLLAMQHRGEEASGMASTNESGNLSTRRKMGLALDVHTPDVFKKLTGPLAIGHNRYSTSGQKNCHLQPYKDTPLGFAFAHNGNLPVTDNLERHLGVHNIRTDELNDSEQMGIAIAQYIRAGHDLPDAVKLAYPLFKGAFSCVAMHDGLVVAFRDAKGIRPLALGNLKEGIAITSETCALDIIDAKYNREIEPGEMVVVSGGDIESIKLIDGVQKLDIFEMVYFARHDSQLYGKTVNEVRYRLGQQLAEMHQPLKDDTENTLVIPVPDTSVPASEGFAESLGLRHRSSAIIKNRYIGRTFMHPSQKTRTTSLRRKHNIIGEAVKGKDLILIDDSIVRGNTLPRLVRLAKDLGAKSVMTLIASPPVRFPDFYGIDTPVQPELMAANLTTEQMRERIGCDYLGFLSLSRTVRATQLPAEMFSLSCFNGEYPVGIGRRKAEYTTPVSMEYID